MSDRRTLVLSAFPAEADAILARASLDADPTVVVDGRHFYRGTIGGKNVVVAMTGIGMVNAANTTETALASGLAIDAVVFAGVAGGFGRTRIGDVAIPARWTSDAGTTWHAVDADMLTAATTLDVDLTSRANIARVLPIDLGRRPRLHVGGDGSSGDHNGGIAFPAMPSIPPLANVFGAQPRTAPDFSLRFTGNFAQALRPFLVRGLRSNAKGLREPVVTDIDAIDQETAAAQRVSVAHGIPFLGIRGMSDGPGDPLRLPGYPFSFLVYKQIAADNAAIVTEALLQRWGAVT